MYRVEGGHFVDGRGERFRRISGAGDSGSPDWTSKQERSLGEYEDVHVRGKVDPIVASLLDLFRHYIASYCLQLEDPPCMLDVGCGIYPKVPSYIPAIPGECTYVGLDPIRTVHEREYLFINATIEESASLVEENTFNLAVFCTSLDHFENVGNVARAVGKLLRKGSLALFFVGLHDVRHVAPGIGASAYERMFSRLGIGHFLVQWVKATLSAPYVWYLMMRRDAALRRKAPLDGFHFHYFTEGDIREAVGSFGELIDVTHVPCTNAFFFAVRRP